MSERASFVDVQVLYDFCDRCSAESRSVLENGDQLPGERFAIIGLGVLLTIQRLTDLIVDHEVTAAKVAGLVSTADGGQRPRDVG